jgi:putative membrane protein
MAAERTWLAWWRSALVAIAGALGVGRLAPQLLHVAAWPYVLLGIGYTVLAIGLIAVGAYRQRNLQRALTSGADVKLGLGSVGFLQRRSGPAGSDYDGACRGSDLRRHRAIRVIGLAVAGCAQDG